METEQIVLLDRLPSDVSDDKSSPLSSTSLGVEGRERFSFVQIRGSAPVFWAQVNNLRYTPDLQIMDLPETVSLDFSFTLLRILVPLRRAAELTPSL